MIMTCEVDFFFVLAIVIISIAESTRSIELCRAIFCFMIDLGSSRGASSILSLLRTRFLRCETKFRANIRFRVTWLAVVLPRA